MAELTFTVDSALLSELGEKLVETAHIALVELVKNAYDADATEVTVKIIPREDSGPEIQVIDNGQGMTLKTWSATGCGLPQRTKRISRCQRFTAGQERGQKELADLAAAGLAHI